MQDLARKIRSQFKGEEQGRGTHFSAWVENVLMVAILWMAIVVRLPYLARGFNYDEFYTLYSCIQQPNLFDALFKDYWLTNHLGYTALAYLSCRLFGISEWAMRLPALLFGVGSIVVLWRWGRGRFGKPAVILAAACLAVSPVHAIWSSIARGYSALIFFTLLSTCLHFRLIRKPSWHNGWALVLVNTLAMSFHIFFLAVLFIQVAHVIWLAIQARWTRSLPPASGRALAACALAIAVTLFLSALIYIPLTAKALGQVHGNFNRAVSLSFPSTVWKDLLAISSGPLSLLALLLGTIGLAAGRIQNLPGGRAYFGMVGLSFICCWLAAIPLLLTRFLAFLLPFIFLWISLGAAAFWEYYRGRWRQAFLLIPCVTFILFAWSWKASPASSLVSEETDLFRESADFARRISSDGTRFCAFGTDKEFFRYYAGRSVYMPSSLGDFLGYYKQGGDMVCFFMPSHKMTVEEYKIFFVLLKYSRIKAFGQVSVAYLPRIAS